MGIFGRNMGIWGAFQEKNGRFQEFQEKKLMFYGNFGGKKMGIFGVLQEKIGHFCESQEKKGNFGGVSGKNVHLSHLTQLCFL